ncbi:MAG: hypothetical protein Q6363_007475 [Candidatus Njordarchaeota archaeon]
MSVDEVFDQIEKLLGEISEKIGNTDIILISTSEGHLISYYSKEQVDENFVTDLSAMLGSIGEGMKVILDELKIERQDEEFILLETAKHIFILIPLEKASIAVKVHKPALLGAVRAVIKSYIIKINELLSNLEEAQMKMMREEIVKEVTPLSL